jgi:hypothetical protein
MHPIQKSQYNQTKQDKTKSNYLQDRALEAPTGAAEPLPAQSIRKDRFDSLQRVKPHTPEAGHASNPNITI